MKKFNTMTEKGKKIIEDAEKNGAPIFIFTAKDRISTLALMSYKIFCQKQHCDKSYIDSIQKIIDEFDTWQEDNTSLVKKPD